jgi:UDP-glucose 4-epimerase
VVGNVGQTLITEQAPLRPLTPYGATKAASEMLISSYSAAYGVRGVCLRFSNVYGPGMEHKDSFIPRLMKAARDGTGVKVRGDGSMIRDVIQVDDVISGMFAAWHSTYGGPAILGSGQSVTVNEMVATARRVTGIDIPAENVPIQQGEMPAVKLDISVSRSLGYSPTYDLEKGMATVWPDFDPNRTLVTEGAK